MFCGPRMHHHGPLMGPRPFMGPMIRPPLIVGGPVYGPLYGGPMIIPPRPVYVEPPVVCTC